VAQLKKIIKNIIPAYFIDKLIYLKGGWGANPYYPYNDQSKSIFIHIPKTAGISVKRALFGGIKRDHIKLKYFEAYDEAKYASYFKFAIVRNPYDRLVSSYFYIKKSQDAYGKRLESFRDFSSFIVAIQDARLRKVIFEIPHFLPQSEFLKNRKGVIGLDFLGRFESLENDFAHITNMLGVDAKLEHHNQSVHKSYQEYYDQVTLEIVADIYKEDFKLLGY